MLKYAEVQILPSWTASHRVRRFGVSRGLSGQRPRLTTKAANEMHAVQLGCAVGRSQAFHLRIQLRFLLTRRVSEERSRRGGINRKTTRSRSERRLFRHGECDSATSHSVRRNGELENWKTAANGETANGFVRMLDRTLAANENGRQTPGIWNAGRSFHRSR